MDPLSRKLFQTSSARERLSQMGGIMASSPELASTVARFQVGGLVGEPEYVVIIPGVTDRRGMRVRASTLEMIGQANPELLQRSQVMDSATAQSMGIDVPSVRPGDAILSRQLGPQPAAAPTPAPAPLGPDAMDLFSENFGVDDMPPPGPVPAPPPTPAEAIGLDPGPTIPRGMRPAYAPADWQPDPSVVGPLAREQEAAERGALSATQRAEDLRRSAQTALSLGQEQTAAELLAEADALEAQGAEGLRSIEETGIEERPGLTFDDIGDIMPPPAGPGEPPAAGEEITPPARVGNEPPAAGGGETNDPLQELGTQLDQDLRTFFGIEPRDPSSRRAEFDERMSFFQEVFGTRNRNEARDRAMNLAMIGLAIAAGQSPNMLTNIAQGALAGTQAMQRAQAAEQEREEEQRLLVYREMMGEEQEIRRLRQGLGMERFRASLQGVAGGEDTRQEYAYNAALATFLETLVKDIGMDPEAAATRARELAARVAPDAPSAVRARAEAVRTQINQLRAERVPDAEIRRQLVELGVDPTVFGL